MGILLVSGGEGFFSLVGMNHPLDVEGISATNAALAPGTCKKARTVCEQKIIPNKPMCETKD